MPGMERMEMEQEMQCSHMEDSSVLHKQSCQWPRRVKLPSVRCEESAARVKKHLVLFIPSSLPTCRAGHCVLRAEGLSCRRC